MAADVTLQSELSNSCCAALKQRLLKLEEKRNALRQAVKLLEQEVNMLRTENLDIKKECEQEKARADLDRKARENESLIRNELEKEICKLKAEMDSLKKAGHSGGQDKDEAVPLQSRILEGEAEISRLKKLLEKEKIRGDSERKKAEAEKKKAAEAWKLLKLEKSKLEGEKKLAEIEKRKAEDCRLCLEAAKCEANEARSELISQKSKTEAANRNAEIERQKANKEKKRVDLEMEKAIEQRKYTEVEKQKAMDEKLRADHLSQQLEEQKRKTEALKKEIAVIASVERAREGDLVPDFSVKSESSNDKVLKEQLKLERKKAKHAKRKAKLEKARKNLLQQELYLLKEDAIRLSRRLDILDGCFSCGTEGIDGLAKIGNSPKQPRMNRNNRVSDIRVCDLHFQSENTPLKTQFTAVDTADDIWPVVVHSGALIPTSRGSCTEPISGTSSELEPMVGGSVRNKSQNSAILSTSTSFSDRQLMGSQGMHASSDITSGKLAEPNSRHGSAVTILAGKVIKKGHSENPPVVADSINNGTIVHRSSGSPRLSSTLDDRNDVLDGMSKRKGKKRRIQEIQDSVENFCSQGKKFDLKIHDLYTKKHKSSKNRKVSLKQKHLLQPCGQNVEQKLKEHPEIEGLGDECLGAGVSLPLTATGDCAFMGETIAGKSGQVAIVSFGDMFSGDYMKLLELDNEADEERFRIAMERPLSPTLREIEFHKCGVSEVDFCNCSLKQSLNSELVIEENSVLVSHICDVVCTHNGSNSCYRNQQSASMLGPAASMPTKEVTVSPENVRNDEGDILMNAAVVGQASVCHALASNVGDELAKLASITGIEQLEISCVDSDGMRHGSIINFFFVFSNANDSCSTLRVFHAVGKCISQSCVASQTNWAVSEVLHALAMEHDLLPEEKACTFFSLLLCNFFVMLSSNSRSCKARDTSVLSDSLTEQIDRVISDVETRCLLLELCEHDILFSLIEDFLVGGRVWVYRDDNSEPLPPCSTGSQASFPEGSNMFISKTATVDQIVAGGIILASICLAVNYVGFICGASYNILRMCKGDSSWILSVLHVFAYVCGEKYFEQSNYSLVMASIKSVILFHEKGNGSTRTVSSHCLTLASDSLLRFPPFTQCPFVEAALCVDEVILLLMEKLDEYAVSRIKHLHPKKIVTSLAQIEKADEGVKDRNDSDNLNMGNGRLDRAEMTSFQLSDIVSLLELLSCYMSWDWLYDKIVSRLLELLESQASQEFFAAILLLIGQLGRLGISAGGYEQEGFKELRFSLAAILDANTTGEKDLVVELAAVHALTGLLPFEFEELIEKNPDLKIPEQSFDASQSGHFEVLRKWFFQLSKEQQALSLLLFQSDDAMKN